MRGRKAIPTAIRLANSTNGRDRWGHRIKLDEVQASTDRPARPNHLSRSAVAAWDGVCANLDSLGMLSTTDAAAITILAEVLGMKRDAYEVMAKEGTSVTMPNGAVAAHPCVGIYNKMAQLTKSMLSEFGLTPAGRPKLQAGSGDGDPFTFDDLDGAKGSAGPS